MEQAEYQPEIIEMAPIHKPKHKKLAKICGMLTTFFDRLLFIIIGYIFGAGTLIFILFIIK